MQTIEMPRIGRQTPTREVIDNAIPSFMDKAEVRAAMKRWNCELFEWQNYVLRHSLAIKDKSLAYFNVGLSVPRQNGKSEIIIKRSIPGMIFLQENQVYTSYSTESADSIFERFLDFITEEAGEELRGFFPSLPSRKVKNKLIQAYDPITGKKLGRIRFVTRKGGGGRGKTETVIFLDEAQNLTAGEEDSYIGGLSTFKNAQIWYVGTPEPAEASATAGHTSQKNNGFTTVFSSRRNQMLNGAPNSMWMEWGVDKLVKKTDRDAWYTANPSLGLSMGENRGINERYLESRLGDDENFAIEHLGYWSSQERNSVIDITRWNDLKITPDDALAFKGGSSAVAIKSDVNDERVDIAVAVRKSNGDIFVELQKSYEMNKPWVESAWKLIEPYLKTSRCKSIIIDGGSAKAQLRTLLESKGRWRSSDSKFKQGKVSMASPNDIALSSALLVGMVNEKTIFHTGQTALDAAVKDAGKRAFRSSSGFGFYSISGKTSANFVEVIALASSEASKNRIIENEYNNDSNVTAFDNVTAF